MAIQVKPITGNEQFWGDVHPTESQLSLVNDSPTLVSQLNDYSSAVAKGSLKPFISGPDGGMYFDNNTQHRVVFSKDSASTDDGYWVGALSHEIGHFENIKADNSFHQRYDVNPRDPEAYDVNALTGLHQEGEAIYNNWKVEQEIQRNTSTPGQPGTQINMAGDALDGPTQKSLDKIHASDVQLGLTSAQDRNRLIDAAAAQDAVYQPSTSPQENYYSFYGRDGYASPSKLGSPSSVTIGDPAADGNVKSMSETYLSGTRATQYFDNKGKLTSATVFDAQNQVQSQIDYTREQDGGYTTTLSNGQGTTTGLDEFHANGTSTAYSYNANGTQTVQQYDVYGRPAENTAYAAGGATGGAGAEAAPAQPDPVGQMNPAGTANTVADTDQTERDDGTLAINDADASIEDTSGNQDS